MNTKTRMTAVAHAAQKQIKPATSAQFLDSDRVVVALLGKQADENGGERCSIFSLRTGKERVIDPDLYLQGNPGKLAVDAARGRVIFAAISHITVFDAESGAPRSRFATGGKRSVEFVAVSADGALAYVGTQRGVDVWDLAKLPKKAPPYSSCKLEEPLARWTMPEPVGLMRAKAAPRGGIVAVGASDYYGEGRGELHLWKGGKRTPVAEWKDPIFGLDFAPDGKSLFLATSTRRRMRSEWTTGVTTVHRVDLKGKVLGTWKAQAEIADLRCLADGSIVTINDTSVDLRAPESGEVLATKAQKPAYQLPAFADVRDDRWLTIGPAVIFSAS